MSYAVKNIEILTWGREEFVCEHSKWSCAHRHSVKKKENEKEKKKKKERKYTEFSVVSEEKQKNSGKNETKTGRNL